MTSFGDETKRQHEEQVEKHERDIEENKRHGKNPDHSSSEHGYESEMIGFKEKADRRAEDMDMHSLQEEANTILRDEDN